MVFVSLAKIFTSLSNNCLNPCCNGRWSLALLKNGAKSENVKVKNTKVKVLDKYTRCRVVLDKQVDGYVQQDDMSYKLDKVDVVFLSLFNVVNALRDTEYDVVIDHILEHPQSIIVLLKNADITLVEQQVKAGDIINDGEPEDHDCIYWWVKSIEFHESAKAQLDKIVDKMLGL